MMMLHVTSVSLIQLFLLVTRIRILFAYVSCPIENMLTVTNHPKDKNQNHNEGASQLGFVDRVECSPEDYSKVAGSIPVKGTCPGWRLDVQ